MNSSKLIEGIHYITNEDGRVVFTALFHVQRGYCCGCKCLNCAYIPKHEKNTTTMDIEILKALKEQAEFLEKNQDSFTLSEKTEKAMELHQKLEQLLSTIDVNIEETE